MKINEVEKLVDITKKNIRFYEQEGLLHPERNHENGYRDYSEKDVEELKKVKLLRKLSVPIEEIRSIQTGKLNLEDVLNRHMIVLEREEKRFAQMQTFCQYLLEDKEQYREMDCDKHFVEMEELEKGGLQFMNVTVTDKRKKKLAPVIMTIATILVMLAVFGTMAWGMMTDTPPVGIIVFLVAFPVLVIVGVVIALIQRLKEIDKGEENEASKY